jgi:hypothetical protein
LASIANTFHGLTIFSETTAKDFVKSLLNPDPPARPTAAEACVHPVRFELLFGSLIDLNTPALTVANDP